MAALTDADGHVAQVTPEGLLQVAINGSVAQANVGVKDAADLRINPATQETLAAINGKDFATQATLEAARVLLNSINGKDFATQATLNSLLTAYNSRTSKSVQQFADGKFRSVSSSVTVPALGMAGLQLINPVGSGKTLTITEFVVSVAEATEIRFFYDSVFNTPTAVTPFHPNRASEGQVTTGQVVTSTDITGGTQIGTLRLAANAPYVRNFVVVLLPGQKVGVRALSTIASSFTLYAGATWIEEVI